MDESRVNYLLEKKVKKIRKETGIDSLRAPEQKTVTFSSFLQDGLLRPLTFLFTEPIVLTCSLLMAISYSLIYGLTEGLTVVYSSFGFDESTSASLSFIPLLIGVSLNLLPRIWDDRKFRRHKATSRPLTPESKLDSLWTSCPALAVGFWIFAWTIPPLVPNVPWPVSMVGLIFVGYATNDLSFLLFSYLTDAYGAQAASACSALSISRTVVASVYPLFTYQMYSGTGLGSNLATTIWAAIATALCVAPFLFSRYGKMLRKKSGNAVKDDGGEGEGDEEKGGSDEKLAEGGQGSDDDDATVVDE